MRTLIIMMFLCLMSNTSLAMMNITEHMVGSAQEYGKSRTEETITAEEFQKPWTIHEVLGQNIYAVKEHIIIYTPYLLVAMDAQNKARAYEMIQPEAGKELADSFNGILVIGAVIDAPERITAEKLSSVLWQNGEEALPYHIELVAASSTEKIVNKTIKANNVGSKVEKNN
ncbi:MAG TPA: hypothetical protein IAB06_02410, partial [Candidatus Avacidaminococcus intestinavium]|nr:hypothetical protein [Candidatus Avacidaminococcus intestinavium]